MANVKPIPDRYPQLSPYICVKNAAEAIEFYSSVFGAAERMRLPGGEGKIEHAELQIGDALIMLSDEYPEMEVVAPKGSGEVSVILNVYVEDVDATFAKAIELGAIEIRPLENQFYGDRNGQFVDPFGHRWTVATHVEDVSPEEMARRASDMSEHTG